MGIETKVESLGNTSRLSPNLRDVAFKELGETDEVRPYSVYYKMYFSRPQSRSLRSVEGL